MGSILRKRMQTGSLLVLFLFAASIGWGQGFEDFTNLTVGSSYADGSFVGNNGITWSYIASRDDNNTAGVNAPALMLRRSSDNSNVTSSTIPNGIGDFSVNLYKGFTGDGVREVELFVNGVSQGTSTEFDDFDEHVFTVTGINIAGDIIIEIKNTTGKQVIVDDITWTAFGEGENTGSLFSNISQLPSETSVTSSDAVMVSADIIDGDGVDAAELHWGTTSGSLVNTIAMTLDAGDTYVLNTAIPAQADGTTVYYEIEATDSNADEPATSTSLEQSYTVADPLPFNIPYSNELRNQTDLDEATDFGFEFNNTTLKTSAGGYIKIDNGSIVSPAIDFSAYDALSVSFDMTTFGGNNGQELSILVSNDNGGTYTSIETYAAPESYLTFERLIDLSSLNGTNGRIKFEMTGGSASIRFRDLDISGVAPLSGYIYEDGSWSPSNPSLTAMPSDNIKVMNGTTSFIVALEVNDITVMSGATLKIEDVLTFNGNIINNGAMVFKSTSLKDGELAAVPATSSITGDMTVERYMSDNRSYRLISSPVATTSSIQDNWQEGATSATDNPNLGYGTHITGSESGANGFDATVTGNPSLFILDPNAADPQAFMPVENTDMNTINAGEGYLIFVRGDRDVDLSSNDSHSETTLRTTGEMHTGTFTNNTNVSYVQGEYNIMANPYQSAVNINLVISDSENLNDNFAYVYDPSLGTNGAYVTVDLSDGSNESGSAANEFLQPGQAVQVATATNAATTSIVFNESSKSPSSHTATFRSTTVNDGTFIVGQLFTAENYVNGNPLHDSFKLMFDASFDNALTNEDAVKPPNFTENLGIGSPESAYSVERRALPVSEEAIALFMNNHEHQNYTLSLEVSEFDGLTVYFKDNYTQEEVQLENGENTYSFAVNQEIEASLASNRFSIYFAEAALVVDNAAVNYGIELYPNPAKAGAAFYLTTGQFEGGSANVTITDIFGKRVYQSEQEFNNGKVSIQPEATLSSGVYFVQLIQKDKKVVKRLMIN